MCDLWRESGHTSPGLELEVDHREPVSRGGADQPANRRAQYGLYGGSVPEISVTTTPDGHAYIRLGEGEVRDSVVLGEHEEADRIPGLDSLVLHFDFYGRLTAIEVTGDATAVLPPGLIGQ
jgi:hypothetical protein